MSKKMKKKYSIYLNLIICLSIFVSMAISDSYKEPNFTVISKYDNIEIRQYDKYVIAKTSIPKKNSSLDDNMFSVLAGYIFGGNNQGKSIPMTTPVITKESDSSYDMIFFMLDSNTPNDLPRPNSSKINLETFSMGKIISIRFGMWATEERVLKYKTILDQFIKDNNITISSNLMIAQYNSPWIMPPFRRNELMYQIN
tara:strand:- start:100 stop:693 length:594 start_codon:yes stop_codon:yes gene_type:complete